MEGRGIIFIEHYAAHTCSFRLPSQTQIVCVMTLISIFHSVIFWGTISPIAKLKDEIKMMVSCATSSVDYAGV